MSVSTPESKIKRKVVEVLKEYKVWYFFPANNGFGRGGIPDLIAIVSGQFVGIECKADRTKKPTALQLQCAKEIQDAGGTWFLAYDEQSIEAVKQFIQKNR
jgi:hypothetical protein